MKYRVTVNLQRIGYDDKADCGSLIPIGEFVKEFYIEAGSNTEATTKVEAIVSCTKGHPEIL